MQNLTHHFIVSLYHQVTAKAATCDTQSFNRDAPFQIQFVLKGMPTTTAHHKRLIKKRTMLR